MDTNIIMSISVNNLVEMASLLLKYLADCLKQMIGHSIFRFNQDYEPGL